MSVDNSAGAHCRKQNVAQRADPWYGHAHRRHPGAIALPVQNGVNDLEVAFDCDHHQTGLAAVHADGSQSSAFDEDAKTLVAEWTDPVSVVLEKPR